MTKAERKRALAKSAELAYEAATRWRVYRKTSKGVPAQKPRIVDALTEKEALRRVRGSYAARPVLPSSTWRDIYSQVGLARP